VEDQDGAFTHQDASPPSASQRSWRIRHGSWLADLFTPIGSCFLSLLFFCCFGSIIVSDVYLPVALEFGDVRLYSAALFERADSKPLHPAYSTATLVMCAAKLPMKQRNPLEKIRCCICVFCYNIGFRVGVLYYFRLQTANRSCAVAYKVTEEKNESL
jgi:hypothetical protein